MMSDSQQIRLLSLLASLASFCFLVAADFWLEEDFTSVCIGVLGMAWAGPLTTIAGASRYSSFRLWMPFAGGPKFVVLQSLGWFLYSACLTCSIVILCNLSAAKALEGSLSALGILGLASTLLLNASIPTFREESEGDSKDVKFPSIIGLRIILNSHSMISLLITAGGGICFALADLLRYHYIASPLLWIGALAFSLAAFITHTINGPSEMEGFQLFQPFQGGWSFITLQGFGWMFLGVVFQFVIAMPTDVSGLSFDGLLTMIGVCGMFSQVTLIVSLSHFRSEKWQEHAAELQSQSQSQSQSQVSEPQISKQMYFCLMVMVWPCIMLLSIYVLKKTYPHSFDSSSLDMSKNTVVFGAIPMLFTSGPLSHASGKTMFKNYSLWQPFEGGMAYVMSQAFGWMLYSVSLVLVTVYFYNNWSCVRIEDVLRLLPVMFLGQFVVWVGVRYFKSPEYDTLEASPEIYGATKERLAALVLASCGLFPAFFLEMTEFSDEARMYVKPILVCENFLMLMSYVVAQLAGVRRFRSFQIWQPFKGGQKFVLMQVCGWTSVGVWILAQVVVFLSPFRTLRMFGLLSVLGIWGVVNSFFLIYSQAFFEGDGEHDGPSELSEIVMAFKLKIPPSRRGEILEAVEAIQCLCSLAKERPAKMDKKETTGTHTSSNLAVQLLKLLSHELNEELHSTETSSTCSGSGGALNSPYDFRLFGISAMEVVNVLFFLFSLSMFLAADILRASCFPAETDSQDYDWAAEATFYFGCVSGLFSIGWTHLLIGPSKFKGKYRAFMPFRGGFRFVTLQAFGWLLFSLSIVSLLTCSFVSVRRIPLDGVVCAVGTGYFFSQLLLFWSLFHFDPDSRPLILFGGEDGASPQPQPQATDTDTQAAQEAQEAQEASSLAAAGAATSVKTAGGSGEKVTKRNLGGVSAAFRQTRTYSPTHSSDQNQNWRRTETETETHLNRNRNLNLNEHLVHTSADSMYHRNNAECKATPLTVGAEAEAVLQNLLLHRSTNGNILTNSGAECNSHNQNLAYDGSMCDGFFSILIGFGSLGCFAASDLLASCFGADFPVLPARICAMAAILTSVPLTWWLTINSIDKRVKNNAKTTPKNFRPKGGFMTMQLLGWALWSFTVLVGVLLSYGVIQDNTLRFGSSSGGSSTSLKGTLTGISGIAAQLLVLISLEGSHMDSLKKNKQRGGTTTTSSPTTTPETLVESVWPLVQKLISDPAQVLSPLSVSSSTSSSISSIISTSRDSRIAVVRQMLWAVGIISLYVLHQKSYQYTASEFVLENFLALFAPFNIWMYAAVLLAPIAIGILPLLSWFSLTFPVKLVKLTLTRALALTNLVATAIGVYAIVPVIRRFLDVPMYYYALWWKEGHMAQDGKKILQDVHIERRARYGSGEAETVDVVWPTGQTLDGTRTKMRGSILYVHGGGWVCCNSEVLLHSVTPFAREGYVVYSVDYPLSPDARFPEAIVSILKALHWMRARDGVTEVLLLGDSAGGNIVTTAAALLQDRKLLKEVMAANNHVDVGGARASMFGTSPKAGGNTEAASGWSSSSALHLMAFPQVKRVCSIYGVLDRKSWKDTWSSFAVGFCFDCYTAKPKQQKGKKMTTTSDATDKKNSNINNDANKYHQTTNPATILDISSHNLKSYPETLLICGTGDPLLESSRVAHAHLREAGRPAFLREYPGAHGFLGFPIQWTFGAWQTNALPATEDIATFFAYGGEKIDDSNLRFQYPRKAVEADYSPLFVFPSLAAAAGAAGWLGYRVCVEGVRFVVDATM